MYFFYTSLQTQIDRETCKRLRLIQAYQNFENNIQTTIFAEHPLGKKFLSNVYNKNPNIRYAIESSLKIVLNQNSNNMPVKKFIKTGNMIICLFTV